MQLLGMLLLPFAGAALAAVAGSDRTRCALITAFAPVIALALLMRQRINVFAGNVVYESLHWLPQAGLDISLRLDGLAFLFATLILAIGLLVIVYARYYLAEKDSLPKLYSLLLLFMGAMLGIVLSNNILLMLVFWELTSLTSFLLVGYWQHRTEARHGARMALIVTASGGLALLAGLLLLGNSVGSFELDVILLSGEIIRSSPHYPLLLSLILLGAFSKSAQFPLHFWLPHAMAAPTPVSSYLHSATMVKAGIFLLARLHPALAGTELWFDIVTTIGMLTLLYGAVMALLQNDLKGLLAFSTISHLGLITLLFGIGTPLATLAALFHIVNHAIFKASLFMAAGIIDHETGTRDLRRLRGLWRYMPHTGVLAMVAAAAMAGVPLLNGFLSKEMFFAEAIQIRDAGGLANLIPVIATIAGIFSVAYSLRFIHDVFFNGEADDLPKFPPHEPPRYMKLPVEILALLCLAVGVFPAYTVAPFLNAAAISVVGQVPNYSLALWHGFNLPLAMSCIALGGGAVLYAARAPIFRWHNRHRTISSMRAFEFGLIALFNSARKIINALDNRSLPRFVAIALLATIIVEIFALAQLPQLLGPIAINPIDVTLTIGALITVVATAFTLRWHRTRLLSLLPLGVIGLLVTLLFARFSAPDLALTQLAVEFVTLLLMLFALRYMPATATLEKIRWRDAIIPLVLGTSTACITLAILTQPYQSIAHYFTEHAVSDGGGHNVVNVILVDFRGFDTLGEISVLLIAAAGIGAMLHGIALQPITTLLRSQKSPLLLATLASVLLPLALLIAVHLLVRGHNLPGGGFVAGLVAAVALLLQFIARDERATLLRLSNAWQGLAAIGVLIAIVTGVGSFVFKRPFLTSSFGHWHIPLFGDIELATAMLFDLGVFFVVLGAMLRVLTQMFGQSESPGAPRNL